MVMDPVHSSADHGRHRSTVDRGQGHGGGSSEDSQNGAPVRGTSPRLRMKGEGTVVILIGYKRGGGGMETVGRRWGITDGGGARCGWRLGTERREERWGEVR
jgi:hypothetical protein